MKGCGLLLMGALFWSVVAFSPSASLGAGQCPDVKAVTLYLGLTPVTVAVHLGPPGLSFSGTRLTLLLLHANERVAAATGCRFVREHGGRFVELRNGGERCVKFRVANDPRLYSIDPNRIFTPMGLQNDSDGENIAPSLQARAAAATFAADLIKLITDDGTANLVIALHNNAVGRESALGHLSLDADDINPREALDSKENSTHPRVNDSPLLGVIKWIAGDCRSGNFVIVTEKWLFEALGATDLNVGLQDGDVIVRGKDNPRINDGSLSVYCAMHGISYANIEAVANKAARDPAGDQWRMLTTLLGAIDRSRISDPTDK